MKAEPYQIILRPLITEKGVELAGELSQYPFEVHRRANKAEIQRAVEALFAVRVKAVRTMMRHGKPKRLRINRGTTRR